MQVRAVPRFGFAVLDKSVVKEYHLNVSATSPDRHVVKCLHKRGWTKKMLSKQQGWVSPPLHLYQLLARKQQLSELQNNIRQKSSGQPLPPSPVGGDDRRGAA